jgi:hypothetical protein
MPSLACSECNVPMIVRGEHGLVERIPRDDDPMSRYGVVEYLFQCPTCDTVAVWPPPRESASQVRERLGR